MINVLYIDDETDTEKMNSRIDVFLSNGIKIFPERDLKHILSNMKELLKGIDLIIVDLIMPPKNTYNETETNGGKLTGLALIKDIRKLNKSIPILIVSILHKSDVSTETLKTLNISSFQEKRLSVEDLSKIVKNTILK